MVQDLNPVDVMAIVTAIPPVVTTFLVFLLYRWAWNIDRRMIHIEIEIKQLREGLKHVRFSRSEHTRSGGI